MWAQPVVSWPSSSAATAVGQRKREGWNEEGRGRKEEGGREEEGGQEGGREGGREEEGGREGSQIEDEREAQREKASENARGINTVLTQY